MVGRGEAGLHHILAASSLADERTRVLKQGDTFAVFDHYGDIKPGGLGEEGLYYEGTRYLSCLLLELEGSRPFFLSSTVRDWTNPSRRCECSEAWTDGQARSSPARDERTR